MWYWLVAGLLAMVFRSYVWDVIAPPDMDAGLFWQVHGIAISIGMLCFVKAAGYGRSQKNRILIDMVLAFMWADLFDRIFGINYLNWKDWFILPIWAAFTGLALFKQRKNIVTK